MSARRKALKEERLDRVFHSLADPARRKIIALLRESGELPVGVVGQAFAMTQNGVSKHVKVLEQAGLVQRRVRGREHWLRLRPAPLREATRWLEHYRKFWET